MDLPLQITATPVVSSFLTKDDIQNISRMVVDQAFKAGIEKGKSFRVGLNKDSRDYTAALDYREDGLFLMIGLPEEVIFHEGPQAPKP